jgi:hypothetical protein
METKACEQTNNSPTFNVILPIKLANLATKGNVRIVEFQAVTMADAP